MDKKFDIEGNCHDCTPMSIFVKINSSFTSMCVDSTLYRSMIWSLLYITASKPDIAFSVGIYARFQYDPKESHLTVIKKILKYLDATINYGVCYSKDSNLNLVGYSDVD